MNSKSKAKNYRSEANRSQSKLRAQTTVPVFSDLSPARQFLICVGWLRLFKVITEPYKKRLATELSFDEI
jgi:hypothetical protein